MCISLTWLRTRKKIDKANFISPEKHLPKPASFRVNKEFKFLVKKVHTLFLQQSMFKASEVEKTWISLICWPHKMSTIFLSSTYRVSNQTIELGQFLLRFGILLCPYASIWYLWSLWRSEDLRGYQTPEQYTNPGTIRNCRFFRRFTNCTKNLGILRGRQRSEEIKTTKRVPSAEHFKNPGTIS